MQQRHESKLCHSRLLLLLLSGRNAARYSSSCVLVLHSGCLPHGCSAFLQLLMTVCPTRACVQAQLHQRLCADTVRVQAADLRH